MREENKIKEDYQEFMRDYVPEYISKNISDDNTTAEKETITLFNGNLNDIDTWLKYEEFKLKKRNQDSERQLRERNAERAFVFTFFWAVFVVLIIFVYGCRKRNDFQLSEMEFMFICGTLTTSMFAFYLIVIKSLFPNK